MNGPGARKGAPLILITRPQEPGRLLAARLRAAGCDALWWPAFDLLPPEDEAALQACAARVADFDLVIFVSVPAVQAFGAALAAVRPGAEWPAQIAIAAVGGATAAAVRSALPGAERARLICPPGEAAAEGGSEALWSALQDVPPAPRRVLLVRAQRGRDWLIEKLQGAGAQVEQLAAYRRVSHVPGPAAWGALRAARGAGATLSLLFTSTEAIAAIGQQAWEEERLAPWRAQAVALCVHARIQAKVRAAGYADVRTCDADPQSVRAALAEAPRVMASTASQ